MWADWLWRGIHGRGRSIRRGDLEAIEPGEKGANPFWGPPLLLLVTRLPLSEEGMRGSRK
jgi:hypothetical protein